MRRIKLFQVDAFSDGIFGGNPAAVCILDQWMDDEVMQKIGAENNLSETAFVVPAGDGYEIRWFTPTVEVDLCGHATLASAFVLFNYYDRKNAEINFHSLRSGLLKVSKAEDLLFLDFPADVLSPSDHMYQVQEAIGLKPAELYKGKTDYMAVLNSEEDVRNLRPDFSSVAGLSARGLIVTAPGKDVDFVARFFAPQSGIDEDPVTGSAYTAMIPYWSEKLDTNDMVAAQLSQRGGIVYGRNDGSRVIIGGKARLYLIGEIFPDL